MVDPNRLSPKAVAVLELIADGQRYAQIVDGHPGLSYLDIFAAAQEALELNDARPAIVSTMAASKAQHPNAYQPWTAEDDTRLRAMHKAGVPAGRLADVFQRAPSAISSRLAKLGLV